MGFRPLVVFLAVLVICEPSLSQRIIVKHNVAAGRVIADRAKVLGLAPVRASPAHGLTVLLGYDSVHEKSSNQDKVQKLLDQIHTWPGVLVAEEDQPRYLTRPFIAENLAAAASLAGALGSSQASMYLDCTNRDLPLSNSTVLPEYQPYGLAQIQAAPNSTKLTNRTDDKGVLVCIIDSGLDIGHPDLLNNSIDGCKYEDEFAPAGCPFIYNQDFVGHGTHIGGTIAAQKNGRGVIGVIPGPAEVYVVRVFNNSGDVNQGQGLVYGSTLILAFTQCEGRLAAMQAAHPEKNYRMVVSMSLGAAGPLSIEKMFFREALKRGDIIFVASSGNNGTAATQVDGKLTSMINPGNYPGSYEEVIAVAAVDCANQLATFSQKNPTVDLAAPGVNILSTASRSYPPRAGLMAGGFMSDNPKIYIPGGIASSENQVRFSGAGKFTGKVVDCGTGSTACPQAKNSICLVQYDPQLKPGDLGKASSAGSTGGTGIRGSVFSQMALSTFGEEAAPITGVQEKPVTPGKFFCDAVEFCMSSGAKAVLLGNPNITTGFYGAYSMQQPATFYDLPLIANLDCSDANCSCWQRISALPDKPPTAGLSLGQYAKVKAAVADAAKAGRTFVGTVESQADAYQRLSGTSMAVPHVSGAIARVWADYPYCNATTVRAAFEESALDLGPKGKDMQYGHGLVQAEAAHDYLARQPCAAGWQAADLQQQAAAMQQAQGQGLPGFLKLSNSTSKPTGITPILGPAAASSPVGPSGQGQQQPPVQPVVIGISKPAASAALAPPPTGLSPAAAMTPVVVGISTKPAAPAAAPPTFSPATNPVITPVFSSPGSAPSRPGSMPAAAAAAGAGSQPAPSPATGLAGLLKQLATPRPALTPTFGDNTGARGGTPVVTPTYGSGAFGAAGAAPGGGGVVPGSGAVAAGGFNPPTGPAGMQDGHPVLMPTISPVSQPLPGPAQPLYASGDWIPSYTKTRTSLLAGTSGG